MIELNELSKKLTLSNSIFAIKKIIGIYEIKNKPSNTAATREKQAKKLLEEEQKKREGWKHGIQVYPCKRERNLPVADFASIVPFGSYDNEDVIGYNIAAPKQELTQVETEYIAKALGAFSLCYEKIKSMQKQGECPGRKTEPILVNKEKFQKDFNKIEIFSQSLIKARDNSVKDVFRSIENGSGKRILK